MEAKEGEAVKLEWDAIIRSLVLIRIGQELGSSTQAARAVHDIIEIVTSLPWRMFQ